MNGCYTLQLEVSSATNSEKILEVEEGTGTETEKALMQETIIWTFPLRVNYI